MYRSQVEDAGNTMYARVCGLRAASTMLKSGFSCERSLLSCKDMAVDLLAHATGTGMIRHGQRNAVGDQA